MTVRASWYATQLRRELGLHNRRYARGRAHVESYGDPPVIVYAPSDGRHGNFFDQAYAAISSRPEWMRRFDKVHAQARSIPNFHDELSRRWRELDSSMSSDALLMNVFCAPGVVESQALRNALGVESDALPIFGWKARVPLASGRFDRTEVDMRLGSLLVEAKLTEGDFQTREAGIVESYKDFDTVFERGLLPRVALAPKRRKEPTEFPEDYTQEPEYLDCEPEDGHMNLPGMEVQVLRTQPAAQVETSGVHMNGYAGYQLIRNVLAAYAGQCSFCVLHDERRPDLREDWFQVMAAVKSAEMRVRLKVLTWQELSALLPRELQEFLDLKYGIVALGNIPSPIGEVTDTD